jgi:hypothetical protein
MDSSGMIASYLLQLVNIAPHRHQIAPIQSSFFFFHFLLTTMVSQRRGRKKKSPMVGAIHKPGSCSLHKKRCIASRLPLATPAVQEMKRTHRQASSSLPLAAMAGQKRRKNLELAQATEIRRRYLIEEGGSPSSPDPLHPEEAEQQQQNA